MTNASGDGSFNVTVPKVVGQPHITATATDSNGNTSEFSAAYGANNGPALRTHCGYPFFHPDLVSRRSRATEQITRNVLNKFINP